MVVITNIVYLKINDMYIFYLILPLSDNFAKLLNK